MVEMMKLVDKVHKCYQKYDHQAKYIKESMDINM